MAAKTKAESPTVIKKYANRRLYNTDTSSYVTLDDLREMVREESEFVVRDAKTGEDITRQVLTQIILEQESNGTNLLPVTFLRSVIRSYGEEAQKVLPPYLDAMMENFVKNQQQFTDALGKSMAGYSPFSQFEEISKQNMALFQQAMSAFNPFDAMTKPSDKKKKS